MPTRVSLHLSPLRQKYGLALRVLLFLLLRGSERSRLDSILALPLGQVALCKLRSQLLPLGNGVPSTNQPDGAVVKGQQAGK